MLLLMEQTKDTIIKCIDELSIIFKNYHGRFKDIMKSNLLDETELNKLRSECISLEEALSDIRRILNRLIAMAEQENALENDLNDNSILNREQKEA